MQAESTGGIRPIADLDPIDRQTQQKAWNWYDWANSAFYTTILTVFFGPYIEGIAGAAVGCDPDQVCSKTVNFLGLDLAVGSLSLYTTTFATILSAFILPIVGAIADRSSRKKLHMAGYAWAGAASASLLFFTTGTNWLLGVLAVIFASVFAGCSLVSYYAILVDISTEEERDRASSRGWAWGYLGGGLLLVLNLALDAFHTQLGLDRGMSTRISMLSAAVWWAGFTLIPFLRLRNYPPQHVVAAEGSLLQRSFGQLWETLKEVRKFPQTMRFLLAYLFYNDGINTVIYAASIYGVKQLGFPITVMIVTILLIQFVAFGGALLFGRAAERYGAYRVIFVGTLVWVLIVGIAMVLPAKNAPLFYVVAVLIGLVMGGTQALSRSFFSLLIPRGREGEYFALYSAVERGTSWIGTLLFAVVFQLSGSYRPAVASLVVFFVIGAFLLARLNPRQGIIDAGNRVPSAL